MAQAQSNKNSMIDLVKNIYSSIRGRPATSYAFGSGSGGSPNTFPDLAHPTDEIYKSVIPNFLYKPAFGYPLNKDVPELRRLAKTPYVAMVINTICDEIASMEWDIKVKEGKDNEVPDEVIEEVKKFFTNPNINDESLEQVLRKGIRDLLELDAMVLNKIYNLKGDFIGIMCYDSGTFTKNPDIHGVMPSPEDGPAYFQYGWSTGARPIPFNRDEIIYIMRNPRADSIYGMSPVENILSVVQMLQYGVDSNLEYFTDNQIPKGFFKMVGATKDDILSFFKSFSEVQKKKDEAGNYRKIFHKMPVINTEGDFVKVGFSNLELELLAQQQWFSKLVWANFGITPSEMGFTEDSNRATEVVQSGVFKRKAIKPIINLLEYYFDRQIINELPGVKGKYEDMIHFDFDKYDVSDELANRQVAWGDIQNKLRTVNEIREDLHLEPLPGGDTFESAFDSTSSVLGLEGSAPENNADSNKELNAKKEESITEKKSLEVGVADDRKDEDYDKEDLAKGIAVEKEHTDKEEVAKEIAKDHLDEDPKYYDKLEKMEGKGVEKKKAFFTKDLNSVKEPNQTFLRVVNVPGDTEGKLVGVLDSCFDSMMLLLQKEAGDKTVSEIKAIDDAFIKRILLLLSFDSLKLHIGDFVKSHYYSGLGKAEKQIESNRNFVPNEDAIRFLSNYSFGLISDLSIEARNDLRAELQRGLMNGESVADLSKRVRKVMDVSKERAVMIARTESIRAENAGALEGYKQSGLIGGKRWIAAEDERTCPICGGLDNKVVPLNSKFVWGADSFDIPPAHPRCRCAISFVKFGGKKE